MTMFWRACSWVLDACGWATYASLWWLLLPLRNLQLLAGRIADASIQDMRDILEEDE